jgi:hypothetical protein
MLRDSHISRKPKADRPKTDQLKRKNDRRHRSRFSCGSASDEEDSFFLVCFVREGNFSVVSASNLKITDDLNNLGIYKYHNKSYDVEIIARGSQSFCERKATRYSNDKNLETTDHEQDPYHKPSKLQFKLSNLTPANIAALSLKSSQNLHKPSMKPASANTSISFKQIASVSGNFVKLVSGARPKASGSKQLNDREHVSIESIARSSASADSTNESDDREQSDDEPEHVASDNDLYDDEVESSTAIRYKNWMKQIDEKIQKMNEKIEEFQKLEKQPTKVFIHTCIDGVERDLIKDIHGRTVTFWCYKVMENMFTRKEMSENCLVPNKRSPRGHLDPIKVALLREAMIEKYKFDGVKADKVWAMLIKEGNSKGRNLKNAILQIQKKLNGI